VAINDFEQQPKLRADESRRRYRPIWFQMAAYLLCAVLSLGLGVTAAAQDASERAKRLRRADLEWDEIEGAVQYEIKVESLSNASLKPILFKTKATAWNGRLLPGKYRLLLRTYDRRGVPGEWGDPSEFWVKIEPPVKLAPAEKAKVEATDPDLANIEFSWRPVIGAEKYKLDVLDETGQVIAGQTLAETSVKLSLPVARNYSWRVTGIMSEQEESEADESTRSLDVIGPRLKTPQPREPLNEWVQEVEWSGIEKAESYSYTLERRAKGGWRQVEQGQGLTDTKLPFAAKHPGGRYRLSVHATAKMRQPSDKGTREFNVRGGERSPEAANLAMLKESLDKPTSFYAIASYFITNISYQGTVKETATSIRFDALGGTGRIGAGYLFKNSPWSTFLVADLSGFNIGGATSTFASAEAHVVWRRNWNISLLRASSGLFYKELPLATGVGSSQTFNSVKKVASVGPHAGFEFIYPFTYRLGMQANARIYFNAMALSTPNGQEAVPAMSTQFSLLGSYRLARDLVGFAGYSYRQDTASYKAKPGNAAIPGSGAAQAGDINAISITGHYLNLVLEYAF
jgi:hypothetical protein